jgi:excisionase family DNA binding protein
VTDSSTDEVQDNIRMGVVDLNNEHSEESAYLKVSEVSKMLKVSTMTVYREIRNRNLSAIQFGQSLRIHKNDLRTYIENRTTSMNTANLEKM